MIVTLSNEALTLTAQTLGAEMQSLTGSDQTEYLWNGDPAYWSGRAPHLFPTVGALRGQTASSQAGPIHLPQHGFARRSEFSVEQQSQTDVTFLLTDSDKTREQYPYAFQLRVSLALHGSSVTTTYRVTNTGKEALPYGIGGHPAFRVPLVEGECFEDYRIEFEQPETADCPQIDMAQALINDTTRNRLLTQKRTFSLNHVLFRADALVFDQLRSQKVKLVSDKSGHGVEMDFSGMPFLGIWSPVKDSLFVCLEPWATMATRVSEDDVFEHKIGICTLQPGETGQHAYTISVF